MTDAHIRQDGFLPIGAYGLIGDCRSVAHVGIDGSIDWCCLPRFDDASLFGRLLDRRKGGYWQIQPRGDYEVVQRYRDRTNVLTTIFSTPTGRLMIVDAMPVDEETIEHHAKPHARPRVVRLVECLAGSVRVRHDLVPRPGYGERPVPFRSDGNCFHGDHDGVHFCVQGTIPIAGEHTSFTLSAGEAVAFGLRSAGGRGGSCGRTRGAFSVAQARDLLHDTRHFWWRWMGRCKYDGPYPDPVWRSALALKLMSYSPTGAIVAAPTTSLPEMIGGPRNWDYRFTWLRDASFTLYAFFQLGMTEEAHDFFRWLRRTSIGPKHHRVPNLYDLDGGSDVPEKELRHLQGYRGSRPVRIGNGAVDQLQLDVYGELLDSAYLYARFGGEITKSLWEELSWVVELAIEQWDRTDASIWESRAGDQHYTYSKVMCWVAVDRGLRIAQRFKLKHDADRWAAARREIHRRVTEQGYSKRLRSFTQVLDGSAIDAATLRLAQVRFLPARDPRVLSTIRAVHRHLAQDVLVRRYDTGHSDDGLHTPEGAFLMCSFWMVDALAHLGEVTDAERRFERLLCYASPTGLFAEEVDLTTGEMLGNYPQAFTHLSLVGAAVNIERARHRRLGVTGLKEPPVDL